MAKLSFELDTNAVLGRMIEASGKANITKLAEDLGLSSQALLQSKARQSISLSLLLKASEKYGISLDYLVRGGVDYVASRGEANAVDGAPVLDGDDDYIELVPLNEKDSVYKRGEQQQPARFNRRWLEFFLIHQTDLAALRSYFTNDKLYIIDVSDRVLANGVFAFNHRDLPFILSCSLNSDGSWHLDGHNSQTEESIHGLGIVGRVIWKGSAV